MRSPTRTGGNPARGGDQAGASLFDFAQLSLLTSRRRAGFVPRGCDPLVNGEPFTSLWWSLPGDAAETSLGGRRAAEARRQPVSGSWSSDHCRSRAACYNGANAGRFVDAASVTIVPVGGVNQRGSELVYDLHWLPRVIAPPTGSPDKSPETGAYVRQHSSIEATGLRTISAGWRAGSLRGSRPTKECPREVLRPPTRTASWRRTPPPVIAS
jgi:hypothetical protein